MASGGSDSDLDFSSAPEDLPSNVPLPEHDGLPQVRLSLLSARLINYSVHLAKNIFHTIRNVSLNLVSSSSFVSSTHQAQMCLVGNSSQILAPARI